MTARNWNQLKLLGGATCLDFANTVNREKSSYFDEWLTSYVDLIDWGESAQLLTTQQAESFLREAGRHSYTAKTVFASAIALRETIYRIFSAIATHNPVASTDLLSFNQILSKTLIHLQIIPTAEGFTWTWIDAQERLDSILWPVIRSAGELLTAKALNRVRECAADDCSFLFVDVSRNRSRCWCDMEDCGNRSKAKRHYERHKKKT
jgi:predicted RNA-binding Zn ribbon-like protein